MGRATFTVSRVMTLRRIILALVIVFLCFEIHIANEVENETLVSSLAWVLVVVLMLPMERFDPDNIMNLLKTWKGDKQ